MHRIFLLFEGGGCDFARAVARVGDWIGYAVVRNGTAHTFGNESGTREKKSIIYTRDDNNAASRLFFVHRLIRRIVINATHVGRRFTGDTAIDDLEFVNCDPGEKRRVSSRDSLGFFFLVRVCGRFAVQL